MDTERDSFEAVASDTEPGMNLISVDFDLVMVNRANERLYAKPITALLGKKCYREFEKRDEPCPHCPGRLALATGEPHEAETIGVRDDGTRFAARIRAHPIIGPDNKPTGFIEVVEDITEQKRAENLARLDSELQESLVTAQNIPQALRLVLKAALRMESIDLGAVFQAEPDSREHRLVQAENVPPDLMEALTVLSQGASFRPDLHGRGGLRAIAVVPILHRGTVMATLLAGTTTYPDLPPSIHAGLQTLGATAGNAISRILAEKCRGDAVADLEQLIFASPLPTWVLDSQGRVTLWNRAAERVFGWKAGEVKGQPPPWSRESFRPVRGKTELEEKTRGEHEGPTSIGKVTETSVADVTGIADVTGVPHAMGVADTRGVAEATAARLAVAEALETWLPRKSGEAVPVRLHAAPFRDVVGNRSSLVVIAEDLSLELKVAELERALEHLQKGLGKAPPPGRTGVRDPSGVQDPDGFHDPRGPDSTSTASMEHSPARVLIIDAGEPWGAELASLLGQLGHEAERSPSVEEALGLLERATGRPGENTLGNAGPVAAASQSDAGPVAAAAEEGPGPERLPVGKTPQQPFSLVVVSVVGPGGSSALSVAAALRTRGWNLPVLMSSDSEVRGYQHHGIAAVIRRPFRKEEVAATIEKVLGRA